VGFVPSRNEFVVNGTPRWGEFDALIGTASKRKRLTSSEAKRFGVLQRYVSADLAVARAQFPGDPVTDELEQRVAKSVPLLYDRAPAAFSFREFVTSSYWRMVAERGHLLLAAWLLMMGPAIAVCLWAVRSPEKANLLLGGRMQGRTSSADIGLSVGRQTQMASEIFVNNIRVSIFVFALGITFCLGSAWLLAYNGAMLGMVAGTAISEGHGDVVVALVAGHGVLELSVIVVAAVAGMRIGMAVVRPGNESRRRVIQREALAAVMIVLGTMPFFVLAGLIEGFFTPAGFGVTIATIVGVFFGGAYWFAVWRFGWRPLRRERYARAASAASI
jgi:uncharacterized membrane protein SpoIIM required for sporulation